ncbi:MAG: hypothetical protein A2287_10290 [Candidatus Melainabacteria bacterium RIFOXYA12_FULL_32_12]|nr:MAG: hypothetical protein A2104_10455 [Candidatus Melainabacteria bacterium GWF2_32_7]OGI22885.1 MAG: hypothetical protein A2255_05635 [Candidatus Melainabacteria bacterium RIFOXYA2_FULL_32_9]OGI29171.1 MAG: hypothetical protein A2287_10290 [Candidatus Melainabacteria bacterium RIFOXYA12_FULL_32_12]
MLVQKINPNTILSNNKTQPKLDVSFGYRETYNPIDVINADEYARNKFIKASQPISGPDYVQGERSIIPYLLDMVRGTIRAMSSNSLSPEARKVREGLDIIA